MKPSMKYIVLSFFSLLISTSLYAKSDDVEVKDSVVSNVIPADSLSLPKSYEGNNTIDGGDQDADGEWGDDPTGITTPRNNEVKRISQGAQRGYTTSGMPAPKNYKGIVIQGKRKVVRRHR